MENIWVKLLGILGRILVSPLTQLFRSKWLHVFFQWWFFHRFISASEWLYFVASNLLSAFPRPQIARLLMRLQDQICPPYWQQHSSLAPFSATNDDFSSSVHWIRKIWAIYETRILSFFGLIMKIDTILFTSIWKRKWKLL